ncbi:MAG TPA: VWA domain-containing protein [Arsenicitalea sp.]|jgi:Ca-activated chloride channel family protein|nr:VWA domain-containing protein [Arsenicitalea sp.]
MTFIWMQMLWLLLAIPLMIGAYVLLLRRKKRGALRYANLAMVKQAMGNGPGWRRHVPPVLFLIAITALILAVARPAAVVTLASSRATIILAMDVSGSMRAEDVDPSRIVAAQKAAKQFIGGQPSDVQVGIVAFASAALLVQAPTIDREALYAAIDRFQLRRGTAVGAGILTSLSTIFPDENFSADSEFGAGTDPRAKPGYESHSLDEQGNVKAEHVPVTPGSYQNAVVILLTDGATTTGPDPVDAGQMAADYGVRVYTVGFGSPGGDVIAFAGRSMRAQPDIETLKTIAKTTDAQFFEAQSSNDLDNVYRSLSTKLVSEKKLTEISFIFAGIGAIFALLAASLSMLWFGRIA